MKLLICLFSFDCNTSLLRCLHAAHVLLKKAQRAHAGLVWSTGAQACEAAEIDEKAFQIGKCKLAVYLWNTWPMPQMRVRDRKVMLTLIWPRNCAYFIYFFSWMGGEKASQCVGHTLTETGWRKPHAAAFPVTNTQLPLSPCSLCLLRKFQSVQFVHHNGWIGGSWGAGGGGGGRTNCQ